MRVSIDFTNVGEGPMDCGVLCWGASWAVEAAAPPPIHYTIKAERIPTAKFQVDQVLGGEQHLQQSDAARVVAAAGPGKRLRG